MSIRHVLAGALLVAVPAALPAQTTEPDGGVTVRVNGPVSVAAGDTVGMLVVINGDATVNGTAGGLVVIGGTATVTGEVREDIVVARGHLDIVRGAVAGGDIMLYGSTLSADPMARLAGTVHDEPGLSFSARASWHSCG